MIAEKKLQPLKPPSGKTFKRFPDDFKNKNQYLYFNHFTTSDHFGFLPVIIIPTR